MAATAVVGRLVQLGDGGKVDSAYNIADKELVIGRCVVIRRGRAAAAAILVVVARRLSALGYSRMSSEKTCNEKERGETKHPAPRRPRSGRAQPRQVRGAPCGRAVELRERAREVGHAARRLGARKRREERHNLRCRHLRPRAVRGGDPGVEDALARARGAGRVPGVPLGGGASRRSRAAAAA